MNINYNQRRQQLLSDKQGPCAAILFSGRAPMRSADGAYEFSVDRDFYYMTGIDHANMILVLTKDYAGNYVEALYIEPYDEVQAKWVGGRMRPAEATALSGIENIRYLDTFEAAVNTFIRTNRGEGSMTCWLDLWKHTPIRTQPWRINLPTSSSRSSRRSRSRTSSATSPGCASSSPKPNWKRCASRRSPPSTPSRR